MHEARESHLLSTSNIPQIQPSIQFYRVILYRAFLFAVAKGTFYHFALTEIQLRGKQAEKREFALAGLKSDADAKK